METTPTSEQMPVNQANVIVVIDDYFLKLSDTLPISDAVKNDLISKINQMPWTTSISATS